MNKTHGDILYSSNITTDGWTTKDSIYRQKPEDTTGGLSSSQSYGNYQLPRGEVGWICPICGRGLAPSTSYCPCSLTRNITYLNGGVTIKEILDNSIDCNSTPPATTTTSKCNDGVVYGAHYDMHN